MRALKFLRSGGVAPFSGFQWPLPERHGPGRWVAPGRVEACATGVHACTPADLPYWLDRELWWIELDGEVLRLRNKLAAPRGRLLERVAAWDEAARREFAVACAARAAPGVERAPRLAGYAADAATFARQGSMGTAGFVAARVAELVGGFEAYLAERAEQAGWLIERLGLES